MNENIKSKYFQVFSDIKRCEDNFTDIAQRISELPDCDERHELFKQMYEQVSTLREIAVEVVSDLLKEQNI